MHTIGLAAKRPFVGFGPQLELRFRQGRVQSIKDHSGNAATFFMGRALWSEALIDLENLEASN